ncbi:hypothetical protein ANN_17233 [Periplaneta americana]|uniref:Uncharacterized protein n=1 Tax=Periplaneta americana TaxID=6978 RepID=A0ABQ8SSC7_PERAM|nr:hypothetical protein ANN_17233 [Periplaneta americana]
MSPGSNTESCPAFAHIGLRENPGKNLNQVTCPDRESNPGQLVSRPDALTVTPQHVWGKRPLGRPRRRWEDNIKMDLREVAYDGRDWINLAQDRDQWRAFVRVVMNLRVVSASGDPPRRPTLSQTPIKTCRGRGGSRTALTFLHGEGEEAPDRRGDERKLSLVT